VLGFPVYGCRQYRVLILLKAVGGLGIFRGIGVKNGFRVVRLG